MLQNNYMIYKLLRFILAFTLLLVVSAASFYYPMFKEAVSTMPEVTKSKKIIGCKDSEQIECWEKVIFENMKKDYFYPTKQSLVMSFFLYYQYEVRSIKDENFQREFSSSALKIMTDALNDLRGELQKEKQLPHNMRDLLFPFAQFYRMAQLGLAEDTISLAQEKVDAYKKEYVLKQ